MRCDKKAKKMKKREKEKEGGKREKNCRDPLGE